MLEFILNLYMEKYSRWLCMYGTIIVGKENFAINNLFGFSVTAIIQPAAAELSKYFHLDYRSNLKVTTTTTTTTTITI